MENLEHTINKSLKQHPDYSRLDNLSNDVWDRIRDTRQQNSISFIPTSLKFCSLALSILAVLALSQITFTSGQQQADLFDLRYFSYQSTPSLNIASVNTYEFTP